MWVEIVILLTISLVSLYMFLTRHHDYWKKRGITYMKPSLLFGNIYELVTLKRSIGDHLAYLYRKYSEEPLVGFFSFDKPALLIRDPEIIKHILIKDFDYFPNRIVSPNEDVDPLGSKMLIALTGPKWEHFRVKLNPAFTTSKIKKMVYLVDECCNKFTNLLRKYSDEEKPVEIRNEMAKLTATVVAVCGFGLDIDATSGNYSAFLDINKDTFRIDTLYALARNVLFFAPHFIKTFKIQSVATKTYDLMRQIVWDTVAYREKTGIRRDDFLDCVMELRKKDNLDDQLQDNLKLIGDDFAAQLYVFVIAGTETTTTALTFASYELAMNQDIQIKVRQDIRQSLEKHKGLTYEAVQDMTYLDKVVKESLRKYPPVPFLDRMSVKPYTLPGTNVTIDEGTQVYIPIQGLHHDPKYFPKPQEFHPERFYGENFKDVPKMAYIPFGEGRRICIAARFGELQVKIGLIHLLDNFYVDLAPGMTRNPVMEPKSFTTLTKGGIHVLIKPAK